MRKLVTAPVSFGNKTSPSCRSYDGPRRSIGRSYESFRRAARTQNSLLSGSASTTKDWGLPADVAPGRSDS